MTQILKITFFAFVYLWWYGRGSCCTVGAPAAAVARLLQHCGCGGNCTVGAAEAAPWGRVGAAAAALWAWLLLLFGCVCGSAAPKTEEGPPPR